MSYGVNAPQGLVPCQTVTGAPWTASIRTYQIASGYATSIFIGDPVLPLTTGYISATTTNAASQKYLGVFLGCQYTLSPAQTPTPVSQGYWPASTSVVSGTTVNAYVLIDPMVMYDVQSDVSGVTFAQNFSNALVQLGTGSTATGISGAYISGLTTTNTYNLTVQDLTPAAGNAWGIAYNNVLCTVNTPWIQPNQTGLA